MTKRSRYLFQSVAFALCCAAFWVMIWGPCHVRHDYWLEPRGLAYTRGKNNGYVTCSREGNFDPYRTYLLFTFPGLVRRKLQLAPHPCSGDGVAFPDPAKHGAEGISAMRWSEAQDLCGLYIAVYFAAFLVSFVSTLKRRLRIRSKGKRRELICLNLQH